jgi:coenzyme F420-reducing hydrogenase delta subunit
MRLQYSPDAEIVLIPCSGRFDVILALKAFQSGADGVFVAGCLEGGCHFMDGNIRARKRVVYLQKELKTIGLEPERLSMVNVSASQGPQFAAYVDEFSGVIKGLGPSPFKKPLAA